MSSNCLLLWTVAKISSLSISVYIFHRALLSSTLSLPPYWSLSSYWLTFLGMSSNCLLLWTAAKISSLSISDYIFHRVLLLSTLSLPPYWSSSWLLSTLSSTVLRVDKPAPVIFIWVFIAFGSMLATCTLASVLSLPSFSNPVFQIPVPF